MSATAALHQAPLDAVRAALAAKPDGVLEEVAASHGVTLRAVLDCLPAGAAVDVGADRFEDVWAEIAGWGTVMFIVHTQDGVFETKAPLPPGTQGRGYFNIHGDSPLGGHIKADRCAAIYFIDRPFFGRRSCSVQFMNRDGDAMFKVFVGRDAKRELLSDQVERFERLRDLQETVA